VVVLVLLAVLVLGLVGGGGTLVALRVAGQKADAADRLAALEKRVAEQNGAKAETGVGETRGEATGPEPGAPDPVPVVPEPVPVPDSVPVVPEPVPIDPTPTPNPDPPSTPRPQGDLSPETEALMQMSVAQLETRLEQDLDGSLMPPSARTQVREAYELYKRTVPAGAAGDAQIKYTLVQYIKAYANPNLRAKPGDKLTRAKLEQVFMTMDMPNEMSPELRKTVLVQALATYDDYEPAEDAEFLIKLAIASMIRSMASDPKIIDRP
jgi:hypothetical protein